MVVLKRICITVSFLALIVLAGCQIERGKGNFPERTEAVMMPDEGKPAVTGEPTGNLGRVNGYWLLYLEDRVCIESDLVGEPTENIIWSRG